MNPGPFMHKVSVVYKDCILFDLFSVSRHPVSVKHRAKSRFIGMGLLMAVQLLRRPDESDGARFFIAGQNTWRKERRKPEFVEADSCIVTN